MVGSTVTLPVGGDGQQPLHGVRGDHATLGIEVEAEHAPAGVGEHLLLPAVGIHAHQVAARHRGVELAIRSHRDVLRTDLIAEIDHAQPGQAVFGAKAPV